MKLPALFLLGLLAACADPAPAADEPRSELALEGTHWTLSPVPAGARAPTLEFSGHGRAGGFAGCNQWFAQVERAHSGLRFSAVGMTRRACAEREMRVERGFAESLAQTRSAERRGEQLVLFGENGEELARFTPAVQRRPEPTDSSPAG